MADFSTTELKNTLTAHLMKAGKIPTEQELADSAGALLSFFEILIEADKKLMKDNELSNLRNPDIAD